jgi:hypothetical protein
MMRRIAQVLGGLVVALALVGGAPARAQSSSELNQKLAKYDPAAVKAALHYFEVADMKSMLTPSVAPMRDAIVNMTKGKNPGVDDATLKEFVEIVLKVMYVDNAEFFEKFTIVTMLDIYTTEEIIAIDKFYSSDVGRSMIKKTPQIIARLPQMFSILQNEIVPLALQEAQKALKAKGKDIRI